MPEIIKDISLDNFKTMLSELDTNKVIILRFTAEWCGPCKNIDGICNNYFGLCSNDITPVVVDVVETIDLYVLYKRYKMLNGIPALYAYYGNNRQEPWYVPNDSVNTGDSKQVTEFFNRCTQHINNLKR